MSSFSFAIRNGASVQKEPSRGVPNFVYCRIPIISYVLYKNHVWKKIAEEYIFREVAAWIV